MKRTLSITLAVLLVVSLFSGMSLTATATLGQNEYHSGAERNHYEETITEDQIFELASGDDYKLTLAEGVTAVTLVGNGAEFDEAGNMTSMPNEVILDASATPGVTVTLENVYISNNFNQANSINFSGTGNTLVFRGTNVFDTDNNAYGYAAIHVGVGTELTVYGETDGKLYFYKREQGAGIGGNTNELNGDIIFGMEGGENDFTLYMKGTKQGALIGAGSNSASSPDNPGSVTFYSGVYNLISNSRGAVIGGSAGGTASSGTNVYVNGACLNINIDYSGSAIGGGGYGGGNDSTGGNLYVSGGSIRAYIDANAASATSGWMGKPWTQGINDAAITALRQNADGEPVYWCIVSGESLSDVNNVWVDGELFYAGPAHNTCYIQETLDKGNQYTITSTPSNWLPNEDNCFYLYLTGEEHTVQINDEEEVTYEFVPTYGEDGESIIGGSFVAQEEAPTYAVAFSGVTANMSVEVFDALEESCGTGNNYLLPDGEYTYEVTVGEEAVSSGSFTVDGAAISVPVLFHVTFAVTPDTAGVELGGNEGQSGYVAKEPNADGSYDLQAGSYQLTITAEHYQTVSETITVSKAQTFTYTLSEAHSFTSDGFCSLCGCCDPDATAYLVRTPANLAAIAAAVNDGDSMAGKTVTLCADLDLSDYPSWQPIGGAATKTTLALTSQEDLNAALEEHFIIYDSTGASYVRGSDKNGSYDANREYYYVVGAAFAGSFDGATYSITNLSVDTTEGYAGLFGNVSGSVKNLTLSGTVKSTTTADFVGGLAGKLSAGGTVENCTVDVDVTALTAYNVGGVVGFIGEPGQMVSDTNPMAAVSGCINQGDVTGYVRTGGIAGRNAGTISCCVNYGTIFNQSGQKKGTGGIVGMNGVNNAATDAGIVEFCYNAGYVNGNKGYWSGGIAGFQNAASVVRNCYNAGLLYTAATADGAKYSWVNPIVGQSEGAVADCYWLNKDTGDNTATYIGKDETGNGNAGGSVTTLAAKTEQELKASAMLALLNTAETQAFIADCDSFPALSFEEVTAHDYVAVVTDATCTEGGYTTYTCSVCGDTYTADETEALGHDYDAVVTESTCTEGGYTTYTCSVCGDTYTADETEALGHTLTHTEAKAPACKQDGNLEYWHCSVCDCYYLDEAATQATTLEEVTLRGLAHDWGEATYVWTATADGYEVTGTTCCQREGCGSSMEETVTAVCTEKQEATCLEDGKAVYEASFANNKIAATTRTDTVAALGHDWDEGVVTTEPTVTKPGVMTYTCTRCDATRTEEIPAKGLPFTDVPKGKWYYDSVAYAYENDLMSGTSDTTFNPDGTMTRAMLVTVLWRLDGETPAKAANTFTDVPAGTWYTAAVAWAAENNIVAGIGGGKFNPTGNTTREQIAVVMYHYAQFKGYDTGKTADLMTFPDGGKVSSWAKTSLAWANAEGLISGSTVSGVTYLDPQGKATRSQVASLLMRYVENIVKAGK